MGDYKVEFIKSTFFSCAWRDTSMYVTIYTEKTMKDSVKEEFREWLRGESYKIVERYQKKEKVSFDEHFDFIQTFHKAVETNNKYRNKIVFSFGRAQKLINMLLKYYWCAGMLKQEPAHMPLDSKILKALAKTDVNWTEMKKNQYKNCITEAREKIEQEGKSLAVWELETWGSQSK